MENNRAAWIVSVSTAQLFPWCQCRILLVDKEVKTATRTREMESEWCATRAEVQTHGQSSCCRHWFTVQISCKCPAILPPKNVGQFHKATAHVSPEAHLLCRVKSKITSAMHATPGDLEKLPVHLGWTFLSEDFLPCDILSHLMDSCVSIFSAIFIPVSLTREAARFSGTCSS